MIKFPSQETGKGILYALHFPLTQERKNGSKQQYCSMTVGDLALSEREYSGNATRESRFALAASSLMSLSWMWKLQTPSTAVDVENCVLRRSVLRRDELGRNPAPSFGMRYPSMPFTKRIHKRSTQGGKVGAKKTLH